MRAMFNMDVATGMHPVTDEYSSEGPEDTWLFKNVPPKIPEPSCYILYPSSCTEEQYELVMNGSGIIRDYVLVQGEEKHPSESLMGWTQREQKTLNEEL